MLETGGAHLKKVLALVLAFACAFTMFAGAAFTDQSDIAVDSDVVDTMTALGVIEGYLDGSFRPDDTVTRGEMAKMIYVVRTGRSDASAYNDDATTFTDIGDHWARGYIKYCNSLGIIAGHSATRFAPDDTVTTQEAAKMLLVTLGYNAETAGLVGAGWGTKTNALADENGLLEDVVNGTTQALPRQYAAQLIYNAIFTPTVVLRDGEYTNLNYITGAFLPTIGERYMGLKSVEAKLKGYTDGKANFDVTDWGDNKVVSFADYTADHSDLVGRDVRILYKESTNSNTKATIYGIFEIGDFTYIDTIVGDVDDAKNRNTIEVNGEEYDIASDAPEAVKTWATANSAHPVTVTLNENDEVYAIDKDAVFEVAQVGFVGSKTITVPGVSTRDIEDFELYDGVAKDDWVVVSYNEYSDKYVLTEADVVTGEVEVKNDNDYTIDGEVYTKADDCTDTLNVGDTVEAVIVSGYIYNVDEVSGIASLDEVVYINGAKVDNDYGDQSIIARVSYADGTSGEINVVKTPNYDTDTEDNKTAFIAAVNGNANVLDGLWAFEQDGDEYTLKTITHGDDDKDFDDYTDTVKAGDDRIGGFRVNDDAVVFVKDGDGDVSVMTGAQVASWGAQSSILYSVDGYANENNGVMYVELAAIVLNEGEDIPGASGDSTYGYVVAKLGETREDNTTYYSYSVWTGSENETIKVADKNVNQDDIVKGSFVEYDGEKLTALAKNFSKVTGMAGDDTLYFNDDNTTEYTITADTQIIYISVADEEGVEGGSIQLASDVYDGNDGGVKENNVLYGASLDGTDWELDYIFVDVNNDIQNKLDN